MVVFTHPTSLESSFLVFLEMNMVAEKVDNSDRIDDDGDADCEDVELVLRDLLPPLPVVVVHQTSPNKIPRGQFLINSDLYPEKVI